MYTFLAQQLGNWQLDFECRRQQWKDYSVTKGSEEMILKNMPLWNLSFLSLLDRLQIFFVQTPLP